MIGGPFEQTPIRVFPAEPRWESRRIVVDRLSTSSTPIDEMVVRVAASGANEPQGGAFIRLIVR